MPHWERPQRCPESRVLLIIAEPQCYKVRGERLYWTPLLWAASDPGARFRTIALQALAMVYGTGVSELVDIGNLLVLYISSRSDHVTNSIILECSLGIGHS